LVEVFPSIEPYLRLATLYLMEYTEDLANEYAYIRPEKLRPVWSEALAQGAN
jgi:hypothetical protein